MKIALLFALAPALAFGQATVTVSTTPTLPTFNGAAVEEFWTPETLIPIIDPQTSNTVGTARLVATPELSLIIVTNSASPQRPKSAQLADILTGQELQKTLRQGARTVRTNVVQNIADVQDISVSSTSTTAQVRSAAIDLRRELIDTQRELRDLAAVVRKMLKDEGP